MTYQIVKSDPESIFQQTRRLMPCNCPWTTPIAINIPSINPLKLSSYEFDLYKDHDFMMSARCIRCRRRLDIFVPIDRVPIVNDHARALIAKGMMTIGCDHQEKNWFVTEPIAQIQSNIKPVYIYGSPHSMYLIFCNHCRRVNKVWLPDDDMIR